MVLFSSSARLSVLGVSAVNCRDHEFTARGAGAAEICAEKLKLCHYSNYKSVSYSA